MDEARHHSTRNTGEFGRNRLTRLVGLGVVAVALANAAILHDTVATIAGAATS